MDHPDIACQPRYLHALDCDTRSLPGPRTALVNAKRFLFLPPLLKKNKTLIGPTNFSSNVEYLSQGN